MFSVYDVQRVYPNPLTRSGKSWKGICAFHAETKGSLHIYPEWNYFKCFGCGKKGSIDDLFHALGFTGSFEQYEYSFNEEPDDTVEKVIPTVLVEEYANTLWRSKKLLEKIKTRVPDERIIKQFKLGYCADKFRFTIPIYDEGAYRNIKMCSFTSEYKQLNFGKGYGRPARLFGKDALLQRKIIICAGEWDFLVLRCFNFPSITGTSGESTWLPSWNYLFEGKEVYIIYDQDRAGVEGAKKVAENLSMFADKVYITDFDIEAGHGFDVRDYFLKLKADRKRFINCLNNSKLFRKHVDNVLPMRFG